MCGTWDDLRRELATEKRRACTEHRQWDVADAVAAVAHWIGVPEPRKAPTALLAAVDPLPVCLPGCTGNCTQEHQP